MRRAALLLLPIGPFCIAALRYLLPYYTADNKVAIVQAVNEHPGRESAVLWLGLVGVLTLVPGLIAAAAILPPSRLKAWAMGLAVPGYLCLGVLLAQDSLLWSGAHSGADPKQVTLLLDSLHPSMNVGLGVFVVGHVLGTVLFGIALLRSGRVPAWAAWAVAVSQPLHFIATVIAGSPTMDLIGWSLTGVGRGDVEHVVHPPVPCAGEPVAVLLARGGVQGCGSSPGRESVPVGEPGDVADVGQRARGDDRSDAGQVHQSGAAGLDHDLNGRYPASTS